MRKKGAERRAGTHAQPTQHQRQAGGRFQPAGEVNPARTKRPHRQSNYVGQPKCSLSAAHICIYESMFVVGQNKHESSARCRPHMFSYEYVFVVGRNEHRSEADPGFTSWQFLVLLFCRYHYQNNSDQSYLVTRYHRNKAMTQTTKCSTQTIYFVL